MKQLTKYIFYTYFHIGVNIIGLPEIHYHVFFRKNDRATFLKVKTNYSLFN